MKRILTAAILATATAGAAAAAVPSNIQQNVQNLAATYGYTIDATQLSKSDVAFLFLSLNSSDGQRDKVNAIRTVTQ